MEKSIQKDRSYISTILFLSIFVVIIVMFSLINHNYFTTRNLLTILQHVSITAITALGLTFVIIVGHKDISFYLNACFGAMFMAWMVGMGFNPILSIAVGIGGGVAFGLASGLLVGVAKLPDIIITIATGTIAFGCSYLFSDGTFIFFYKGDEVTALNNGNVGGIPVPTLIMIALFVVCYIVLEKTKTGRFFYATGSNRIAARFSGINVTKIIVIAFVLCSVFATLGAEINTAAKGNGDVKIALAFLMPAYTSVFLGMAIFKKPSVIGTFLGALLMEMMANGATIISLPYYIGDLIESGLLIAAIFISVINTTKTSKIKRVNAKKIKDQSLKEGI